MLPRGNGRSYGDVCLNAGGTLLDARGLDRFISFDRERGTLRCEAGVLLSDILGLTVPHGWFLPVVPGTRFVTVGGAIANDVHGKNHHVRGSFGCHLRAFELLRSDGTRRVCTPDSNSEWFAATVAGLGLTGLITWAELQLRRIDNPWLATETVRFGSLADFFSLSADSADDHEYTVAWVDCTAHGGALGRGIFARANHAGTPPTRREPRKLHLRMPITPPISLINGATLRAFNLLHFHRAPAALRSGLRHYEPWLFPLDGIRDWNRMYGPHGFLQYQCVLPPDTACDGIAELLATVAASGTGSFLAVLKQFGAKASPGLLSFPRPGSTLALDFANHGQPTLALLARLDAITAAAGGAVYPAKDARMTGSQFRRGFPAWDRFAAFIDPAFSSGFWRRAMQ